MSAPAYNVDAERNVRSFTMFTWYGKCRCPQHYRCPEACGGPYRMGVNGAHNIVGKMSAPTILFVSGRLQSTVSVGDRVWSLVSWFDLSALPCFLRSLPGPFRMGVPGRLVLVGSVCANRRRVVSRVFAYPSWRCGVRVGGSASPGLLVRETVRRR